MVDSHDDGRPWCFVGKRRLEKALAEVDKTKVEVEIRWKPFFLDPTLPQKSVDKMMRCKGSHRRVQDAYLVADNMKFGASRVAQMIPHMQAVGAEEGINFSYGGM